VSVKSVAAQRTKTQEIKNRLSEEFRAGAANARLSQPTPAMPDHLDRSVRDFIRHRVEVEPYWFQRIELFPGYFSPGWSNPPTEKMPYFGLPDDLTGKRVLDVGCAEGFFSFEAEGRGAREVIAIDSYPDSVRRFNIVRDARQSNATAYLTNVYDLKPSTFGTFDLVLFYGVFYHLKHPQLALERILDVCSGEMLFQTHVYDEPAIKDTPWAKFYPHGFMSGKDGESYDPTVFWLYNPAACIAMLDHVGFIGTEVLSNDPNPFVLRARVQAARPGIPPNQMLAPWS